MWLAEMVEVDVEEKDEAGYAHSCGGEGIVESE